MSLASLDANTRQPMRPGLKLWLRLGGDWARRPQTLQLDQFTNLRMRMLFTMPRAKNVNRTDDPP